MARRERRAAELEEAAALDPANTTTERSGANASASDRPSVDGVRARLRDAAEHLRQVEADLQSIASEIPKNDGFDVGNELRDAADCVCRDLLADAIETLMAVADADEAELRRCHQERQQWPAA